MEINKEREAFEQLQNPKFFQRAVYLDNSNTYVVNDEYRDDLFSLEWVQEINYGWLMWQAAKATHEWISISERMPKEGEEVFVHHFGHVVQATKDEKYLGGFKQRNCYGWEAVSSYISHWIPTNVELPQSFNFYYENDAKQKVIIEAQEQSHD